MFCALLDTDVSAAWHKMLHHLTLLSCHGHSGTKDMTWWSGDNASA